MASLSFSSISYDSFRVRVTGMSTSSGTKGIVWYVNGEEYADWTDYDIAESTASSDRLTVDGLEPGTEYEVQAAIYYSDGWDDYVSDTVTTELYEPDFSDTDINVSVDGTDVEITLDGLDPDYEDVWKVQWYVYNSDNDVLNGVTLWSDGYDTRWSFDHLTLNADDDGIQPNTQYTVIAYIYTYPYDNGGLAATRRATFTTGGTASPDRPEEFRWADGTETKKRGQKFDITADEWCDLLDNINAVREYKGYSKFPQGSYTGTSYYNRFTYPTSGQTFRYQHYNQALNAIAGMLGYGYADNAVKQGDSITADRINLLVEWLNGIT